MRFQTRVGVPWKSLWYSRSLRYLNSWRRKLAIDCLSSSSRSAKPSRVMLSSRYCSAYQEK
ncbi:hypothetical protein FQZ97_1108180 [compost metagenome]